MQSYSFYCSSSDSVFIELIAKDLHKLQKNDPSHSHKTANAQQIARNVCTTRGNVPKTNSLDSQVVTDGTSFTSVAKIAQKNGKKSKLSEDNAKPNWENKKN